MKRLRLHTKLGYGTAELGVLAVETLARLHVLKFYTDVVGLRAELAGGAAALAIAWDAFVDPLVGLASDRTRSSMGRRRPWLLAGGIALAVTIALVFHPPALESQAGKAAFLLLTFIAMNSAVSVLSVPHSALASELSFDRDERTELFGYRLFLGNLGLLAGAVLPTWALASAAVSGLPETTAYGRASLGVAFVVLVTALVSFVATRGRDLGAPLADRVSIGVWLVSLRALARDPIFVPLLIAYVTAQLGVAINGSIALYYYEYRLLLRPDEVTQVLGVFVGCWSLSIPLWVLASRRWGKKRLAFGGVLSLGVATAVIYLVAPPRDLFLPMTIAVVGGSLAGSIVLLEALVADVVDVDELRSGMKREGMYFGAWKMAGKLARGLAVATSGVVLGAIGFVPNVEQSPEVSARLAWLFGPGVGGFLVLGALMFLCMPLTDERHRRVQRALARRRDERSRADRA